MDTATFRRLIGETRQASPDDDEQLVDYLIEKLAALPESEIVDYHRIPWEQMARSYTWDLWMAAT